MARDGITDCTSFIIKSVPASIFGPSGARGKSCNIFKVGGESNSVLPLGKYKYIGSVFFTLVKRREQLKRRRRRKRGKRGSAAKAVCSWT